MKSLSSCCAVASSHVTGWFTPSTLVGPLGKRWMRLTKSSLAAGADGGDNVDTLDDLDDDLDDLDADGGGGRSDVDGTTYECTQISCTTQQRLNEDVKKILSADENH